MMSEFSKVAEAQPEYAWIPKYRTPEEIAAPNAEVNNRWCETRLFSVPFSHKQDHFVKTGSGQTFRNAEKETRFFRRVGYPYTKFMNANDNIDGARKRHF